MRGLPLAAERLYLAHGTSANSFAAAFDPDLERHVTSLGLVAHKRQAALGVTMAFFDPLCSSDELPALLDDFLAAHAGDRIAFWKVSAPVAAELARRGWRVANYGVEHCVDLQHFSLGGPDRRGLRRQVNAARRAGIVIEPVSSSSWPEIESVTSQWLATRTRRQEIKLATRRTPHRDEVHCTKLLARAPDGSCVGWAAFDYLYEDEKVVGVGLNAVRWLPVKPSKDTNGCGSGIPGVASFLALEGASMLRDLHAPDGPFTLALGESPFATMADGALCEPITDSGSPVRRVTQLHASAAVPTAPGGGVAWASHRALCGKWRGSAVSADFPRRAGFLEGAFAVLGKCGEPLYSIRGLDGWKRKWRADKQVTYCVVNHQLPLHETLAGLALIVL